MLSDTSLTLAVGELATVIPPAPEKMSKKDLFEPRLNLRVAPILMTTEEGLARVPGSKPLEPPRPSWRVPLWILVPPVQVALGLSMTRFPVPSLLSAPEPETVPVKVWSQAPVSRLPPPAPRIRFRWKTYPPDSDRIWPWSSLIASTAPPAPVSLPSSPPVGVTVPDVCSTVLLLTVRLTVPPGSALPNGL